MHATVSSAGSTLPSCCRGLSLRLGWCSICAAANRRKSRSRGRRTYRSVSSFFRPAKCRGSAASTLRRARSSASSAVSDSGLPAPARADLVEEVVRILGVDRIPATPFDRGEAPRKPVLTPIQLRTRKAKRALAARGMLEAVTWSFVAKRQAQLFGGGKPELALANPIASDLSDMRPSLIPGLVAAAQNNADRGFPNPALFEVGQVFRGDCPQDQLTAASGVRRALAKANGSGRHWSAATAEVDAFDAKADALAVLAAAGAPTAALQVLPGAPPWFHPGRSGT